MTMTTKIQKNWLTVGALVLSGSLATIVACSSSTTTPLPTPEDDSGASSSSGDGGGTSSSGDSGNTSSSGDGGSTKDGGDGGASCSAHVTPTDGPFCSFAFAKDSGTSSCKIGETCCWGTAKAGGGFDPTSCVAKPSDCPAPTDTANFKEALAFECQEASDCNTGVCCFITDSQSAKPSKNNTTCGTVKALAGTRCKASCDATADLVACQADSECGGKKCVIGKVYGSAVYIGTCQ